MSMDDSSIEKQLLTDFVNELSSVTGEDFSNLGIGGNYSVQQEDISKEVISFVLCYLEQRKFPPKLTLFLAKKLAELLTDYQKDTDVEDCPFASAATLHVVALDRLHKLCHQLLEHPETVDANFASSDALPFASVSAIKNKRRKMEDRHVVIHDLNSLFDLQNCPSHSYYAVFDGHGGIDAASFAATHLHTNIIQHPEFMSNTTKAITEAYKLTDVQFCQRVSGEGTKSGCTAVTALIRNDTLYLAWLGDSQALLIKQGEPVKLMAPHTPDRQDERARIESLGGFVCHLGTWRVNGTLAVSRALGDQDFKPYISSEPEVSEFHLDGTEDFLILACDGLWDGMTPEEASSTLYRSFCDVSGDEFDSIAKTLVEKSKLQGSDDNITAVVVFLRTASDISADAVKYVSSEIEQNTHENRKHQAFDPATSNYEGLAEFSKGLNHVPERPTSLCNAVSSFPSLKHDSDLPPEATFLSELPTPPIDDILKEQIPPCEQYEYLLKSQSKLTVHSDTHEQRQLTTTESPKTETPLLVQLVDEHSQPPSAPDQAFEVAASIVSGVVEAAMQRVDNMGTYDPSITNGIDLMSDEVPVSSTELDILIATKETDLLTEIPSSGLNGFECDEGSISMMSNAEPLTVLQESTCSNQGSAEFAAKPMAIPQEENSKCLQDSAESPIKPASALQEENCKFLDQDSVDSTAEQIAIPQNENVAVESEMKLVTVPVEESGKHMELCTESGAKSLAVSQADDSKDIDQNLEIAEPHVPVPVENAEVEMQEMSTSVSLPEADGTKEVTSVVLQEGTDTQTESMELQQSSLVDIALDSSTAHLTSPDNQELPKDSSEPALNKENSLPKDTVDNMELFIQKEINASCNQNLSEASSKEPTLVDDMPAATVAIDLKSVPEFIPEAEGVVEDFDSDSEKDGGWSFIKPTSSDSSELVPNLKSPDKGKECPKSAPSSSAKEKLKVPKPIQNVINQSKSPLLSPSKKQVITKTPRGKTLSKATDEKQPAKAASSAVAAKTLPSPTVPSSRIGVTEASKTRTSTTTRVLPKGSVRAPGSKVVQQAPRPNLTAQKPSVPRASTLGTQQNKEKASVLTSKPDGSTVKKSTQSQMTNTSKISTLRAATAKVNPAPGVIKPQRSVPSSVAHTVKETKNNVNKLIVSETLAARTQPSKRTGTAVAASRVNATVKTTSQRPKPVMSVNTGKVIGDGSVRAPPLKTGIATRNLRKVAPKDEVKKDSHLSEPKTKKEGLSAMKAIGNKRDLKKKTDSSANTKTATQGKSQPTESNSEKPSESTSNVP